MSARRRLSHQQVVNFEGVDAPRRTGLDVEDFDPEDGSILVHGKRHKQRTVYLTKHGCSHVEVWLLHRGDAPGPLFYPVRQTGEISISRMHGESIAYILRRRQEQAGVERFSPHDLRRSTVTDLLATGIDVFTVQKLAGHADATTARYDRRDESVKRWAVQSLNVPRAASFLQALQIGDAAESTTV